MNVRAVHIECGVPIDECRCPASIRRPWRGVMRQIIIAANGDRAIQPLPTNDEPDQGDAA